MRKMMMAAAGAALMVAGCATGAAYPHQLRDGEWRAVDINGIPIVEGSAVTLRIDGGRVSGSSGCNYYSSTFQRLSDQRLRFGPITQTRMACGNEARNEQERRFGTILPQVVGYSFYPDGSLSLISADGRAIRFRRAP